MDSLANTVLIQYIADLPKYQHEKPYQLVDIQMEPEDDVETTNLVFEPHETKLYDLRNHQEGMSFEKNCLKCIKHRVKSNPSNIIDAALPYCNEMIGLLGEHVQADKFLCYDMRIRKNLPPPVGSESTFCAPPSLPGVPFQAAHVDHTRYGGWDRVARHLTRTEKEKYLDGNWRIRIFNIWKSMVPTVEDMPLAICDPTTIKEVDLWHTDQVGPDATGEIYYLRPDPVQRWYWLPQQTDEELLVFLNWDSHAPDGSPNCCPHSAFVDPAATGGVPRESVEVRIITFSKLDEDIM